MGSTKWLKVDLDLLHEGLLAARQAHEAIAASAAGYEGLSTAVGHRRLNTTLDDFGRNWAVHRRRLLDELDTLAGNISHTYEKFRRDDENMGRIDGSPKRPVERPAHNGSTSPATPGAAESAEQAPVVPPAPQSSPASAAHPEPPTPVSDGPRGAPSVPTDGPAPTVHPERDDQPIDHVARPEQALPPNVNADTAAVNAVLDVWSERAEALVKLGLPITALGAGAVALLALFGRLPAGYTLNPDGTVTQRERKGATSAGALDQAAAAAALGDVDGPSSQAAAIEEPMSPADAEGLLSGADGTVGDGTAGEEAPIGAVETAQEADPLTAEPIVAQPPDGLVPPPIPESTDSPSSTSSTAGSAGSASAVMPPPPLPEATAEAHTAMGEATQRLDALAAPAAAVATAGAATLRGSDADAALSAVRQDPTTPAASTQSAAQTRMAAMSSLSAMTHQLSQTSSSASGAGHAASAGGNAVRRSAQEALEALEKPKGDVKKGESK